MKTPRQPRGRNQEGIPVPPADGAGVSIEERDRLVERRNMIIRNASNLEFWKLTDSEVRELMVIHLEISKIERALDLDHK